MFLKNRLGMAHGEESLVQVEKGSFNYGESAVKLRLNAETRLRNLLDNDLFF